MCSSCVRPGSCMITDFMLAGYAATRCLYSLSVVWITVLGRMWIADFSIPFIRWQPSGNPSAWNGTTEAGMIKVKIFIWGSASYAP